MRDLNDPDITILELLAKNSRQSYSDIGKQVGLSGPAVSNRAQRLQESGIIQHSRSTWIAPSSGLASQYSLL